MEGLERWTPHKFTFGVYEYGLKLLDKINAIIDELPPDLNLEKLQSLKLGINTGVELRPQNRSGLSQQLDASTLSEDGGILDSQQSSIKSQGSTQPTSIPIENLSKKKKT